MIDEKLDEDWVNNIRKATKIIMRYASGLSLWCKELDKMELWDEYKSVEVTKMIKMKHLQLETYFQETCEKYLFEMNGNGIEKELHYMKFCIHLGLNMNIPEKIEIDI